MTSTAFGATKTATVNGTTLAYREQGEGEPVVFVHGGISDLRTWEQQLPAVGRSYRAITYSRRFARPNTDIDPDAGDPLEQHAEDLAVFLREINAAPAHIVGNSGGGFITMATAVRHPDAVRTLVLEEPAVLSLLGMSVPPRPAEVLRLIVTRPRTAIAVVGFGIGTMARVIKAFEQGKDEEALRIFSRGVLGKAPCGRLPEARMQQMRENMSTLRAGMLRADDFPQIGADVVRAMQMPVLLVAGELSPPIAIRLTDVLEELLPNVERVEIPTASHLMHEENAPAVNEAILGFLGRHRARSMSPSSP
jgi:pimeloyl-ACP methyl ester carboxylesterase